MLAARQIASGYLHRMKSIVEVRQGRLAQLVRETGGQAALATKIGKDKNQIYQWLRPEGSRYYRALSGEVAREIELACGKATNWMDSDTDPSAPSQPAGLDIGKLTLVLAVVDGAIEDSKKRVPGEFKARMIKRVYESQHALTADSAGAVREALAVLLETLGSE
jgi:transposase-like protein